MSTRPITAVLLRLGQARWPTLAAVHGGLAAATMTLVTAVSYAAVAGAPLGVGMSAAAVLSGLIGAAVGGAVSAAFSPVPGLVFSPRASVAVVIASALTTLAPSTSTATALVWLGACLLLAALLQGAFAMLRLGALIRLIPHSVTAGFTIGIAVQMAWSQWPHVFGSSVALDVTGAAPLVVGGATIAAVAQAHWKGWAGWALTAGVLAGVSVNAGLAAAWPHLSLPHLQSVDFSAAPLISLADVLRALGSGAALEHLPSLCGFALVIAFVNSIETLSSTVVVEELAHHRFDANRALMAGAIGSIVAVCAGGLPVGGSSAASMVNVKAGGGSRHSSLIAAGAMASLAVLVGGVLSAVPLAAVAALLLTVAFALVREPLRELTSAQHGPDDSRRASGLLSGDTAVAALVCALLLTTGMVTAIFGGVIAAAVLIVRQMRRTLVRRQYDANHPDAAVHFESTIEPDLGRSIRVVEVAQPMFFATAEAVVEVLERLRQCTRFAILDLTHAGAIDATARRTLARLGTALQQCNRSLLLVPGVRQPAFEAAGAINEGCRLFSSVGEALRFAAGQSRPPSRDKPAHVLDMPAPLPYYPSALASVSWPRRLQLMVAPLRNVRHLIAGVPEIHTPLDPQSVEQAGRQLAVYIGPVAKLLARRAAPRCADIAALYRTLAPELRSITEREAFLRLQPVEPPAPPKEQAPDQPASASVALAPSPAGLSLAPEVLEQATRDLKPYLGPIAKLLVKRAQAKALDREHLYHLLSRQLSSVSHRTAFLSAAGIHPPLDDID
jgi:sulfate permease, SulP family